MTPHGQAEISRWQFAVHADRIISRSPPGDVSLDIGYVNDCGSESPDALRRSLNDHVNGIDKHLGYKAPDVVILPYLAPEVIAAGRRTTARVGGAAKGVGTFVALEPGRNLSSN